MNKFQKNFTSEEVVILLFVYAVNFNIFNERGESPQTSFTYPFITTPFVEMLESN